MKENADYSAKPNGEQDMKLSDMDPKNALEQNTFVDRQGREVKIIGYQPSPSYIIEDITSAQITIAINSGIANKLEPKTNSHGKKKRLLQRATKYLEEAEHQLRNLMCEFEDDENLHDMATVEDRLRSIQSEREELTIPTNYLLIGFPE